MIYFSEIKGKKVISEDEVQIGVLEDIIFSLAETPYITKILIRNKAKSKLIIPVSFLSKINTNIHIHKNFTTSNLEANELYLLRNILDKQIIDLRGNKVIRVNDIIIQDQPNYYIAGVDVGISGILRWLRLDGIMNKFLNLFHIKHITKYLSWADIQPLELTRGKVKLRTQEDKLKKIRAEDLADYLERTNIGNIKKFLKILDEKQAAKVIGSLNLNFQTALFRNYEPLKTATILSMIDPDESVDILLTFNQKKRNEILNLIDENKKNKILHLLKHSDSALGEIMSTEYLVVSPDDTTMSVLAKIKKETSDYFYFNIVYVVNNKNQLVGLFDLHNLLIQNLDVPVYKFMIQDIIVVHPTTPKDIAIKRIQKYRLYSLPVVNDNKEILGIITLNDLLDKQSG